MVVSKENRKTQEETQHITPDGKQILTCGAYETPVITIQAPVLNRNAGLWNKNLIFAIGALLFCFRSKDPPHHRPVHRGH